MRMSEGGALCKALLQAWGAVHTRAPATQLQGGELWRDQFGSRHTECGHGASRFEAVNDVQEEKRAEGKRALATTAATEGSSGMECVFHWLLVKHPVQKVG